LLSPGGPRVHLSGPTYMPSCTRPEVKLPLDKRICEVVVAKNVLCLAQEVFSYFGLHSNKKPLVLTTKVTHLHSLLFRQPYGINCVVRRVYFGG